MLTGPEYEVGHTLADGTRVHLRHIHADDAEALREGFAGLSPASRYRRFLSERGHLTDAMVRYLTDVDGQDHVALVAVTESPDLKSEYGVGVARFVRLPDAPDVAEAAVTVRDEWQNRGLGKRLLEALVLAARERGIAYFRAEVLAENGPMRALLAQSNAVLRRDDGETLLFDVPLDAPRSDAEPAGHELLLFRLLRSAAVQMAVFLSRIFAALQPPAEPRPPPAAPTAPGAHDGAADAPDEPPAEPG